MKIPFIEFRSFNAIQAFASCILNSKEKPINLIQAFLFKIKIHVYVVFIVVSYHTCRYYSDRGTCAKCYLSCATCSGPRRDQCVTCPKDWQLASGECHPECPEGFFKSQFGCQKCHHYCKTCSGKFKQYISFIYLFEFYSIWFMMIVRLVYNE